MLTKYTLSRFNEVLSVEGNWSHLAGLCLCLPLAEVIGRNLFDLVAGSETASYLNAIFFSCRRSGQSFSDTHSTDNGGVLRSFCMTVYPQRRGELEVSHELVDQKPFASSVNLRSAAGALRVKCSICCRVRRQGIWIAPEIMALTADAAPEYVVCPDCRARANAQLSRIKIAV